MAGGLPSPGTARQPDDRDQHASARAQGLEETVKESHVAAPTARRQVRPAPVRRTGGRAMRWVRFDAGDGPRIGPLGGGEVLPGAPDGVRAVFAARGPEPQGPERPVAD